ncbi:Probable WRKY transcription factor 30 [Striga hermonthica]|uniref:Probable WRKY transcription factor 30 n=1 Tax=Striga hermonthica TaxID=68872 RepID=A0A9N7R5E0_STRHE|nr:Probable WRKY transcription factor 30 [Striga hermonthica]
MENFVSDADMENVMQELSRGREQAMQLQSHLVNSRPSENYDPLIGKIIHSYDQAISMLGNRRPSAVTNQDSPRSAASDDSDQAEPNRDHPPYGRRMSSAKWTQKVKVSLEMGIEGQLDDGFNWRKYGQKDILGAKYPRGYYRCTYRHGQGCLATKQVQRSDEDPTVFEITYRRQHTCNPRANSTNITNPPTTQPSPQNQDPSPATQTPHLLIEGPSSTQQTQVTAQELGTNENPFNFNAFTCSENDSIFSGCDNILGSSSGSGYFTNTSYGEFAQNLPNTDCELSPIVAPTTSSSSTFGSNYPYGSYGYGSNFSFGDPSYYP